MNESKSKKFLKRQFLILLFAIVTAPLVIWFCADWGCYGFMWSAHWQPDGLDHGPFHGTPGKVCPVGKPDQTFTIWDGYKLKSYDKKSEEPAATVSLQNKEGKTLWCIYTIEKADNSYGFKKIRFTQFNTSSYLDTPCVRANFKEDNYRKVSGWWFIERNGKLKEYWLRGD